MEEKAPICESCGQPMFEIGGIGKNTETGEFRKNQESEFSLWYQTGIREQKLYQCPEDKTIIIK